MYVFNIKVYASVIVAYCQAHNAQNSAKLLQFVPFPTLFSTIKRLISRSLAHCNCRTCHFTFHSKKFRHFATLTLPSVATFVTFLFNVFAFSCGRPPIPAATRHLYLQHFQLAPLPMPLFASPFACCLPELCCSCSVVVFPPDRRCRRTRYEK